MEVSMGLVVLFGMAVTACALFYYFSIYLVPAYVGLRTFIWAVGTGAGLGSPVVGLIAGVAMFWLAYFALSSRHTRLRLLVVALYVLAAFFAGYNIVLQVGGEGLVPSPVWRQLFAVIVGAVVSVFAFKGLVAPGADRAHRHERAQL